MIAYNISVYVYFYLGPQYKQYTLKNVERIKFDINLKDSSLLN